MNVKNRVNKVVKRLPELVVASLADSLRKMEVGETRRVPDGVSPQNVRRVCSELKGEGLVFSTNTKTGVQTVTRLT